MAAPDQDDNEDGGSPRRETGAADLATASNDPAELRALLDRARERLSFYEGFDRVIADNVRRSGELMQETLSIREQAAARLDHPDERDRILSRLAEVDDSLAAMRTALDTLAAQVSGLRRIVQPDGPDAHVQLVPLPLTQDDPEPVAEESPWEPTRVVELVAHRVSRATLALSLQRYLAALDGVTGVEAREFAEGILRLQLTTARPLAAADAAAWPDGAVTVLRLEPNLVEIEVG